MSRTAATGRRGRVEAADRLARVSFFLQLDTTPAAGKSRTAAPGRSGRVEAADRSPALYSVCGYYTTPKNKMK